MEPNQIWALRAVQPRITGPGPTDTQTDRISGSVMYARWNFRISIRPVGVIRGQQRLILYHTPVLTDNMMMNARKRGGVGQHN